MFAHVDPLAMPPDYNAGRFIQRSAMASAIYFYGGWNSPNVVVGPGQGPWLYLLGLLIVALYAPLYWWRARQDRKLAATTLVPAMAGGADGTGSEPPVAG